MRYVYILAGLRLLFDVPYELHVGKESEDFLHPVKDDEMPDWSFLLETCDALPPVPQDAHREIGCFYFENCVWYVQTAVSAPYAVAEVRESERKTVCSYLPGCEEYLNYSRNLCELMGPEKLLLHFSGLILHASLIDCNGTGIVFSAPSGTGKSTQARLWHEYRNAQILNGDRAGLRKRENGWMAYGLPFAGSSGIYRNESVPLKAVVLLRQAKNNTIRKMSAKEAFLALLPEINARRWNADFMQQAMDILEKMIQEVPVYMLDCLPDADAVMLLHQTLFQEENI